jgi:hypothetical protein
VTFHWLSICSGRECSLLAWARPRPPQGLAQTAIVDLASSPWPTMALM